MTVGAPTGAVDIPEAGGMAQRRSTGRHWATLRPQPTESATTTGSSATRPILARAVQQSLATGRETSHKVLVSGVALMRSLQAVSRPCGKLPNGKQHGAASSTVLQKGLASPDQLYNSEQYSAAFYLHSRIVPH
jgi:hypothetical protein